MVRKEALAGGTKRAGVGVGPRVRKRPEDARILEFSGGIPECLGSP